MKTLQLLQGSRKGLLLAAAIGLALFFGGVSQSSAYPYHHYRHHYYGYDDVYHHHHRGYWDHQNGVRVWIGVP